MNTKLIIILIVVAVGIFLYFKIMSKFKMPKLSCVNLVTGGVKCGKSTLAVALAVKTYKRNHRAWKMRAWFQKKMNVPIDEEPLLYSNIPLSVPYVPLTLDLLLRKKRFAYKSVLYICEASLVCDNQMYKLCGESENERVMFFNKLFGHETLNGTCIYDTQCIGDLSINVRRCLSSSLYVYNLNKSIPFFLIANVREERYCEDGQTMNVYDADVEESVKKVLISKRTWKYFDAFCYSKFTDDLEVEKNVVKLDKGTSLKASDIVSFRNFKTLMEDVNNDFEC